MPNFYVLDVGHGNSAVLIDKEGVVVIDAGPKLTLELSVNKKSKSKSKPDLAG